jgi:hypothetical protein
MKHVHVGNEYGALLQRRKDGQGPKYTHRLSYANIKMLKGVHSHPYTTWKKVLNTSFALAVPLQCSLSSICIQDNTKPLFVIGLRPA